MTVLKVTLLVALLFAALIGGVFLLAATVAV